MAEPQNPSEPPSEPDLETRDAASTTDHADAGTDAETATDAVPEDKPAEDEPEDRLEDLPGRPIGPDEIDPELVSLPRSATRIGVILSLSVVIFCGYIMTKLYSDLVFSRKGPDPRTLSAMAEAIDPENAEQFVQVRAIPDRSFAFRISQSNTDPGNRMAPVQGSNGALWIMMGGNVWTTGIQYDEVYRGRLRQVEDLPFADDLRRQVTARGPRLRFVRPEAVASALASVDPGNTARAPIQVSDPAGDVIRVTPDTPVQVDREIADRARVHVFSTEGLDTAEGWAAALRETGMTVGASTPAPPRKGQETSDSWFFEITAPGGAEAIRTALREKQLFSALVTPIRVTLDGTWRDLAGDRESLTASGQTIPWTEVSWIAVDVTREVRPGAMVLLTREDPAIYWYVLPLFIALGFFGLLFAWALGRSVLTLVTTDEVPDPTAKAATESTS